VRVGATSPQKGSEKLRANGEEAVAEEPPKEGGVGKKRLYVGGELRKLQCVGNKDPSRVEGKGVSSLSPKRTAAWTQAGYKKGPSTSE